MISVTPSMPKGFLRRKFTAPRLPAPYVRETVLSEIIADVDSWRVCLINASAGYGKTALMSQWYLDFQEREDCLALWLSLDEHDVTVERIVLGLACLFGAVDPRFLLLCDELSRAEVQAVDSMLIGFVNLTDAACDQQVRHLVFIDGYDSAVSDALDQVLLFLNRFCGDNFRFVVSGSYFSPQIDDLLLDSSVVEFRTSDLAFDGERLRALAYALMPDLTDAEYADMCERSGMWPASFVFTYLARRRSSGADPVKVAEGYHSRFFGKEVMSRIDAPTYEFLVETAFLDFLDPDLCDRVVGGCRSRSILEHLESRNLFVRYDAESKAYVLQPAFRRFLLDKTLALRTSYINKLAARACTWFSERGMRNERAKYLAATCDARYIQGNIQNSVGMGLGGDHLSFLDYLISQPAARFEADPYLAWVAVWSFVSAGLPDEARHWISVARELDRVGAGGLAYDYANAICLALEGDSRSSLAVIRRVLEEGGPDLPRAFQCLLIHMEGENCERLGNPKEGRDLYRKALSLAERADGAFYKLFDMYCLAHQCLYIGDLEEAASVARRALGSCEENSPIYGEFHAIIAFVDIERGDLDAASHHLDIAQKRVSTGANLDMYVDVHLTRARYERARGNSIEALEIVSNVVASIAGKKVPRNFDIEAHVLRVQLALELGDASAMRDSERVIDAFSGSMDFLRSIPCMLAKARVLWHYGDREECAELLSQCRQVITACGSTIFLMELNVIEAMMGFDTGNETQAMVCIGKAVETAMRGGYLTSFLLGGPQVRELVLKLATSRKASLPIRNHAKQILLLYGTESEVSDELAISEGGVMGYYALTDREREILHALNAGMSRRELAESFGVSQNTVKTHLKNIYSKLGVGTRSEAYRASQLADKS